jgi:putative protease
MNAKRKPEVKSPAGHWPQLQAAVEAGADGVYFGLKHFTARAKTGFALAELPEAIRTLHRRGVRGYVTFNTLLFEHELAEAARVIASIAESGADGMIVQDFAAVRMAREIAPDLALHGSTQMSITDARGVAVAHELGVERVTLARELSLKEIEAISAAVNQSTVNQCGCDLEIFVHGALCVAYSGQCFSSEAWGGRSANRGQCAQACRLPYELMVDGAEQPLQDARYLLSPGDLYALRQIPEIVKMGIAALKIEGRYKDAAYVALTTAAYRKAVDEAWAGQALSVTPREEIQLEQIYSRGLGPFFLTGTNHQAVVRGRAPRHRGVNIGRVLRVEPDGVVAEPGEIHDSAPLKPGDGVVFDAADRRSPEEPEEGGRVFEVKPRLDGDLELRFANGAVRFERIRPGDLLWRTHDPLVERAANVFLHPDAPVARQLVRVNVDATEGRRLVTKWSVPNGVTVTVESEAELGSASNRGVSQELLRAQLGRLGGTPFQLGDVELNVTGAPFAAVSALNQVRRQAVEQLTEALAISPVREVSTAGVVEALAAPFRRSSPAQETQIHVLVRTGEQLEAALSVAPASITLDYLDLYGLRPSIEKIKAAGIPARVASPRVFKPGEARISNFLTSLDCAILVRPAGLLHALRKESGAGIIGDLIGDFSLNAANSASAQMFLAMGLARITPTHDLNAAQIADLAARLQPGQVEVIAYQHLPVFHTEHCVFCRFMSEGTSFRDCGRPCEKHKIALKDSQGREHPVMADVGCRNTVFGAQAQEASRHLQTWKRAGVQHYRLEFVHEDAAQLTQVYKAFASALAGGISQRELAAKLASLAPQGTTEGSLFVPVDYLQLPVLQ